MERKLANCGRCGLEPVGMEPRKFFDNTTADGVPVLTKTVQRYTCPVHHQSMDHEGFAAGWNAAQFAARTERINAAAVAFGASDNFDRGDEVGYVRVAEKLIDAQDAAARERWAAMQLSPVVDHCTCPPLELGDGSVEHRCSGKCAYYKAMKGGGK